MRDQEYQYHFDRCGEDVEEWCAAIGVPERRWGPMVILFFGGAACRLFGNMEIGERQRGVDIPDAQWNVAHASVVGFIIEGLTALFVVHE